MLLIRLPESPDSGRATCVMPPLGLWSIREASRGVTGSWSGLPTFAVEPRIHDMMLDGPTLPKAEYGESAGISVQFSIQHDLAISVANDATEAGYVSNHGGFHANAVSRNFPRVHRGPGETLYRGGTFEDWPCPTFSQAEIERYWAIGKPHEGESKTGRWMSLETSRGCGGACGFCGVTGMWGKRVEKRPALLWKYLHWMRHVRGIEEVFIEDDNFLANPERAKDIIGQMRFLNIHWSAPNGLSPHHLIDHLPMLEGSTCWKVSIAFETGTEKGAKLMRIGRKFLPVEKASELARRLREGGIKTTGFFIIGYPGETLDDMKRTLEYANSLPLDTRHIYIATPYPGTPLYDLCKEREYLVADGPDLYRRLRYTTALIRTPEWGPDDVQKLRDDDRKAAIERRKLCVR